ncbi:NF-kappa-B inhibitor beta [Suncus etruscus]|uniref:NF-kappa-B inhibitor beta n=1 Tax=Suncus etruscus TaxID=109475 RepID=UPI00210F9456|nr:NF-kappa-B inhibitor beta [Suncus etruscus]
MAGVACLGKTSDTDEWCDSGLGSLGPDAAAPGGPALSSAELGPGLSWAPLVFGYVTEDGDTALHLAVIHQHDPFLDFLLGFAAGTEYLDLQNDLGQTALHLAAILGEESAVEKLYAAGAGVLVAERGGHTALHLACRSEAHGCARALLQPRPRCPRDFPSTTYLTQASSHTPGSEDIPEAASDLEKEEECESEEDWKLQLQAENFEGHTPLHVAVIHRDVEMVRLLREAGADLNKPEPTCGRSPLHLAVEAQSADVLELLLRAGADPTARMYGGRTPLGCAMLRPNSTLAQLLREHGAPEPEEDEDDKPSLCSSSSDSDSGDEGDQYDDIVVHSGRSQHRSPPAPASRPLPADPDHPELPDAPGE